MPTNIRVIRARDFVKATATEHLDFKETRRLLMEVASVADSLTNCEIILDTRKAQSSMSVTDLWNLAAELSKLGDAIRRKIAVLCPTERFDQAGYFALCAQNRGLRVRAFTSFEDAVEWLISTADVPQTAREE